MLSHGDKPICQNLVCLCHRAKTILPDSNSCWKYNFDIEVKVQGHTEVINVCNTSYHTIMPNIEWLRKRTKKAVTRTQSHVISPINLILRSKSQLCTRIMNVLMVIDPCAKNGMPMSKQTEVKGRTRKHDENLQIWPCVWRSVSNWYRECTRHILSCC